MILGWSLGAGAPPPKTVAQVDLDRYQGRWYEIARYPNRFQKDCSGDVIAEYKRRTDGRIDVENRCRTKAGGASSGKGVARLATQDGSTAKLEVRFAPAFLSFIPAVWGDYWVLGLADDYSYAVVGSPDRRYLWFLTRTPTVPTEVFATLVDVARAQGFDPARLVKTPQSGKAP